MSFDFYNSFYSNINIRNYSNNINEKYEILSVYTIIYDFR